MYFLDAKFQFNYFCLIDSNSLVKFSFITYFPEHISHSYFKMCLIIVVFGLSFDIFLLSAFSPFSLVFS
jgi:hypothetical protein